MNGRHRIRTISNNAAILQAESENGAQSGALSRDLPPDLAQVMNAWASLSGAVKAAILELVEKGNS